MRTFDYDWVVIGGGSAGFAGARTGAGLGLRTLVIEGGPIGGLCILRGCMPSKALLESANRFWTLRRAAEFGLSAENIAVDAQQVLARKRRLIGEFAEYRREQLQAGKFDFERGAVRFLDPHTVQIEGGRQVSAASFLIATGSVVAWPNVPGLADAGGITSDEFLEMDYLPKSAIVLGGGAVALEAAYYWNALQVEVTVLQRSPHLLTGSDPEAADAVAEALRKQGIRVLCGTRLERVERMGETKQVSFTHDGVMQSVSAETLLVALGRKPATAGLAEERAGVTLEGNRVVTLPTQQSSAPHIFAAGDVCGPLEVVHVAIQQGEIAARNAARLLQGSGDTLEQIDYRLKLFGVFTSPQMAGCGWTEAELTRDGRAFRSASYRFDDHGKSLVMAETEGFVKLTVDAETNEILGAIVVGPEAVELIHEIVVAMRFRATARSLAETPHYHPTLSEIWTYPAEELMTE